MSQAVVVDASVAVKWVLQETDSERARALLRTCAATRSRLLAPPHFPSEVVNALYQRLRTTDQAKHITPAEAHQALTQLLDILRLTVDLLPSPELYQAAFAFAHRQHLGSLYDSLYVTLAQLGGTELWTGDRRLFTAIRSVAPWVRWIGDYPVSP